MTNKLGCELVTVDERKGNWPCITLQFGMYEGSHPNGMAPQFKDLPEKWQKAIREWVDAANTPERVIYMGKRREALSLPAVVELLRKFADEMYMNTPEGEPGEESWQGLETDLGAMLREAGL